MIEKFDKKKTLEEQDYTIIPKLKPFKEKISYQGNTLERGDTLIMFIDMEKYDLEEVSKWFDVLQGQFPNNQVMIVPLESDFAIIKEKGE